MVLLACSRGDDEEVKTAPLVRGRRGRGSCVEGCRRKVVLGKRGGARCCLLVRAPTRRRLKRRRLFAGDEVVPASKRRRKLEGCCQKAVLGQLRSKVLLVCSRGDEE
jgi:hypothetical protein